MADNNIINWSAKNVLVTGGCSFIGSHLVDALLDRGAHIRVVDDLSSGIRENLESALESGNIELSIADLLSPGVAKDAVNDMDVVFHLAANHGGRGYIDLHQTACATNLIMDGLMIDAASNQGVEQFTFASSGCVYPMNLQNDPKEVVYLTEDLVTPPYHADGLYGWAKLMAELTLKEHHRERNLNCASVRYFTAYGERCLENHAIIAMIARAFVGENPFIVWGTGEQIRNWTYVGDIVEGTIRAAERIKDGCAINLGTMERVRVLDAAREILRRVDANPKIITDPDKPTGPYNRVADCSLAGELLDWKPETSFLQGLDRTIKWYYSTRDREIIRKNLDRILTER